MSSTGDGTASPGKRQRTQEAAGDASPGGAGAVGRAARPSREELLRRNAELKEKRKRIKAATRTVQATAAAAGPRTPSRGAAGAAAVPPPRSTPPPPLPRSAAPAAAAVEPEEGQPPPPVAPAGAGRGSQPAAERQGSARAVAPPAAGPVGQPAPEQPREPEQQTATGGQKLAEKKAELSELKVPEQSARIAELTPADSAPSPSLSGGTPAALRAEPAAAPPERSADSKPAGSLLEKLQIKVRRRMREDGFGEIGQTDDMASGQNPDTLLQSLRAGDVVLEARIEGQPQSPPRWKIQVPKFDGGGSKDGAKDGAKDPGFIKAIQEMIEEEEGRLSRGAVSLPAGEQLLTFKGKRLQSDHHLADPRYGIQIDPGSVLILSQKSLTQIAEEHKIKEADLKEKAKSRKYLKSLFDLIGPTGGPSEAERTVTWQQVFEFVAGDMNQGVRTALNLKIAVNEEYRKELHKVFMSNGDDDPVDLDEFVKCMHEHFGDSIQGGLAAAGPAAVPLPPAIAANPKDASLNLFRAAPVKKVEGCPDPEWPDWKIDSRPTLEPNELLKDATKHPGGIYAESVLSHNVNDEPGNSTPTRAMGDPRRWVLACQDQKMGHSDEQDQPDVQSVGDSILWGQTKEQLRAMSVDELRTLLTGRGLDLSDCESVEDSVEHDKLVARAIAVMHRDVAVDDEADLEAEKSAQEDPAGSRQKPPAIWIDPMLLRDNMGKFAGFSETQAQAPASDKREPEEAPDDFLHASCFVFKRTSMIRIACLEMVQSAVFEFIVIGLIAGNSMVLAMYDPLNPESEANKTLDEMGLYFTAIFAVEMVLKVISYGFVFGEGAYLKTAWNMLDFVVVATGMLDFIPGYESQFGVLRTVRLLRPLKTITTIRSMRVLVASLLSAQTLQGIISVCTLMFFMLVVFGIIGVNFFSGVLRQRCINQGGLEVLDQICTPDASGRQCDIGQYCSSVDPVTGLEFDNPEFDLVSFDDFAMACLTIFTMLTLEGWTDVMYSIQDGFSPYSWCYFVLLITLGSFIGLNLFLAVISSGYENVVDQQDEAQSQTDYARECMSMITSAVYESIHRDLLPTPDTDMKKDKKLPMRPGDKVALTETAIKKYSSIGVEMGNLRGGSAGVAGVAGLDTGRIVNLSQDNLRVRVDVGPQQTMSKVSRYYWYPMSELRVVGQADILNVGVEESDESPLTPSDRLIQERVRNFFNFFDTDPNGGMDGVIERDEFADGLKKLREESGKRTEDNVYIKEDVVRTLLHLLTEEGKHGREREWQTRNIKFMFDAIDDSGNGLITHGEFYNHFMDPEKWRIEEVEVLTLASLSNEKMKGASARHVMETASRWLVGKSTFDTFVSMVVLFNCIVLSSESANMGDAQKEILETLNLYCTIFFVLEMVLKLFALGAQGYWADAFNRFDGVIVTLSLVELALPGESGGLSVFRALRILRVFKVTKSLGDFKKVLLTIFSVLPELSNFFGLLCLFLFFFAVLGLHLFGGTFDTLEEYPRDNFDTFGTALLTVFQILTGENWNAVMYNTVETNGYMAIVYFILLEIIGVYMMLNLFLSVLLLKTMGAFQPDRGVSDDILYRAKKLNKPDLSVLAAPEDEFVLESKSLFIFGPTSGVRLKLKGICANPGFEFLILMCILISSAGLAIEEPGASQQIKDLIKTSDYIFTSIFTFELIIKVVTLGFVLGTKHAYCRNPWNVLDGIIVAASLVSLIFEDNPEISELGWVRGLRVLRALRPLRVIKRVPELKMVVNSLFRSAPIISNVLVLLTMFWLVFGILGLQLFGGMLYYCDDPDVVSRDDCVGTMWSECVDEVSGVCVSGVQERTWASPSGWGFDTMPQAVLTLFEVSTLEMWLDIMYWSIDARGISKQPFENYNQGVAIFFVVFISFGSFFLLEMFVGAIVTSYNMLQEESEGGAFQSDRQKQAVAKMVLRKKDDVFEATYGFQEPLHKVMVENKLVEALISGCIVLNVFVMALYFYDMSDEYERSLDLFNDIFTFIFAAEMLLRMTALLPGRYFKSGANSYDCFVVVVTMGEFFYKAIAGGQIPGAAVLRVFRIARLFKLMSRIKSLMDLVVTISTAIPTLVNVGSVLFLAYFIFAVLGMHLFGKVKRGEFLNEHANFETFAGSLLTTFRMSTGESWNGIMHDCQVAPPHCELGENGASGDCGNPLIAPIFFVLFQLIGQYIMLNLFIAVMLEYYQRQQDSVDPYVTEEQKDQFDDHWERFVGRDPVRNDVYPLLPARLFDDFMTFLPAQIGWSLAERREAQLKRKAMQQGAFCQCLRILCVLCSP